MPERQDKVSHVQNKSKILDNRVNADLASSLLPKDNPRFRRSAMIKALKEKREKEASKK